MIHKDRADSSHTKRGNLPSCKLKNVLTTHRGVVVFYPPTLIYGNTIVNTIRIILK